MQLSSDVWNHLSLFIESDKDKCRLMMTCKGISEYPFYFRENIHTNKIMGSRWFNYFVDVIVDDLVILPKYVSSLTFNREFNKPIGKYIPCTVTKVKFSLRFNQIVRDCLPKSIKEIYFDSEFNSPINDSIPFGVTHLFFRGRFNQPIEGCIPSSITHLSFGYCFEQIIFNNIPPSVTHLTLGTNFHPHIADNIPLSVTHLAIGKYYRMYINIPPSIREITIYDPITEETFNFLKGIIPKTTKISLPNMVKNYFGQDN